VQGDVGTAAAGIGYRRCVAPAIGELGDAVLPAVHASGAVDHRTGVGAPAVENHHQVAVRVAPRGTLGRDVDGGGIAGGWPVHAPVRSAGAVTGRGGAIVTGSEVGDHVPGGVHRGRAARVRASREEG
jgi:hypothetical protein